MIIDNSKYFSTDVHCSTCGKIYRPSKDAEIKEKLNVPPLIANIFCSRACKEKYDEFLESNRALWRIEPYFDGSSTAVTTYKVVDQNGTLQYMGDRNQCEYFLQHGC